MHLAEELAAGFPDVPDYRGILAQALLRRAYGLSNDGRTKEGLDTVRRAVAVIEELAVKHPTDVGRLSVLCTYQMFLADHEQRAGRAKEAAETYKRAFGTMTALLAKRPNDAGVALQLSRSLSMCPLARLRDPARAVALAKKALEQDPGSGGGWSTLALAHYRAGDWKAALAALGRSKGSVKDDPGIWANVFLLAMTHWQLGDKPKARQWYEKGDQWMRKYHSQHGDLWQLRAEAARLLGLPEPKE
jgi:tetratricopeptide (TPR) repeat protein